MKNKLYRIVAKLIPHCDIPLSVYVGLVVYEYLLNSSLMMQYKDYKYTPNTPLAPEILSSILGHSYSIPWTFCIITLVSLVSVCVISKLTSPLFNEIACEITSNTPNKQG